MRQVVAFILSLPLLAFFLLLTVPCIILAVIAIPLATLLSVIEWLRQDRFGSPLRFVFFMASMPMLMYSDFMRYDKLSAMIDDISLG